jgi:predicted metal-binding membrane protein
MPDPVSAVQRRSVAVTVAVAAACWLVAVREMRGMDMGVATALGSFGFFVGVWTAMMAAMMLPGAIPSIAAYARGHRRYGAVGVFVVGYVAVWTLVGVASYAVYRPHGTVVAGGCALAAGLYELTPIKQRARQRCRQPAGSGLHLGLHCVASSVGLMALLLAVGAMSVGWMAVVAALVLAQKVAPAHRAIDAAVAAAILAFGVLVLIDPSVVPGLVPAM